MLAKFITFFHQHTLLTESLAVAFAMIIGKALSFGWKIIASHQGAAVVGEIEIILTTTSLLAAIAIQGLPMALNIWTAKLGQDKSTRLGILVQSVGVAVLSSTTITLLGLIVLHYFPKLLGDTTISPQSYFWTIPLVTISELLFAWLNGRKKYHWYAFGKYTSQPLWRLVSLALMGMAAIPLGKIIPIHLNLAVLLTLLISMWPVISEIGLDAIRASAKKIWNTHYPAFWWQSLALSGSLVLYVIYTASDVYWLAYFHTPTIVGMYSLSLAITSLLELVFMPILNLLQTRLAQYRTNPLAAWSFTLHNSLITATLGVLASLLVLIGKPLLVWLFGQGGSEILFFHVFWLLIWRLIANVIVLPTRHYLDFFDHQHQTLVCMAVSFVVKFGLSWWLVPLQGISGLIIANLIAEMIHAGMLLVVVRHYHLRNSG